MSSTPIKKTKTRLITRLKTAILENRKKFFLFVVACTTIVPLGCYVIYQSEYFNKSKTKLTTSKVIRRDLGATVQATGIVKPMVGSEVKVGARTPGKVVELPINVGQTVREGQVIAKLEQDDLIAKVKLQEAILSESKADMDRVSKDIERERPLIEKGVVSHQQFDKTTSNFQMALARYEKAKAELSYAQAMLSYATITAPIKGVVASVNTIQGETVTTGLNAPTFIKIIDLERLEVQAYVDENDIGKVKLGQEAIFTVASHPGEDFKGSVTSIYPSATIQDNVVYYITTVSVDNSEGKLRPDMTANVIIFLDQRKGVLTVPNRAIQREGSRKFVHLIENGSIERRYVNTGWKDSSYTEILDGLREGNLIVAGDLPKNSY
ncbi:MAG: efflux RND transporter periplasmic adaptor subunit [Syntrophaceae bacterium]|nr:efflux RND transporter periplasmic adaptor subunit [Syntrophaceae bacterium]